MASPLNSLAPSVQLPGDFAPRKRMLASVSSAPKTKKIKPVDVKVEPEGTKDTPLMVPMPSKPDEVGGDDGAEENEVGDDDEAEEEEAEEEEAEE